MDDIEAYPEFKEFLDPTAESITVEHLGDSDYRVTMSGEDGGQLLLRKEGGGVTLVTSDNVLDFTKPSFAPQPCSGPCTASQHAIVAQAIMDEVDNFSTSAGPDGGNLACVWAVRHIVKEALGFWITKSDGTAVFDPALLQCFGASAAADTIPPGGIIISPTSGSNIGHVGLLGTGSGGDRLVYSNSSKAAMWKQNFTVASWRARYKDTKGLPVHFFPLPSYGS